MPRVFLQLVLAATGLLMAVGPARAAILTLEEFDTGLAGWDERDLAEMAVSWDNVDLWAVGQFGGQVFPTFESDAFRIDSGTDFLGDYVTPGLTQIRFDLYAEDVLPSDLFIRLVSNTNVFDYQFGAVNNLDSWQTFTVDLDWSFGWNGAGESAFNSALANVTALEIQVTRSGTGSQSYYLDNVETLDTDIGGGPGGPGGAVPEPNVITMIAPAAVWLAATLRRKRRHKERRV